MPPQFSAAIGDTVGGQLPVASRQSPVASKLPVTTSGNKKGPAQSADPYNWRLVTGDWLLATGYCFSCSLNSSAALALIQENKCRVSQKRPLFEWAPSTTTAIGTPPSFPCGSGRRHNGAGEQEKG